MGCIDVSFLKETKGLTDVQKSLPENSARGVSEMQASSQVIYMEYSQPISEFLF